MLSSFCPGSASLRGTPTLTIKSCPQCGSDVELFSIDFKVPCDTCGFVVYNNLQSCVQWCQYAEACVGKDTYEKFKRGAH